MPYLITSYIQIFKSTTQQRPNLYIDLYKIFAEYAGKAVHLVLDNARYQKCRIVTELAGPFGIELNYVPPYSPNLDLIEGFWKFAKGKLRTEYYDEFSIFWERVNLIIESMVSEKKGRISKLIGQKIQLFDEPVPMCKNTFAKSSQRARKTVV